MSSSTTGKATEASITWTIARRLGTVVALGSAFILSATLTIYLMFRSGDTRVPDVIGKTEVEARKMAETAGLRVKIQRRTDSAIPVNTVMETRPGPNSSVKTNSIVMIIVSDGPQQAMNQFSVISYQNSDSGFQASDSTLGQGVKSPDDQPKTDN